MATDANSNSEDPAADENGRARSTVGTGLEAALEREPNRVKRFFKMLGPGWAQAT